MGEPCHFVCQKRNRTCNADVQSMIRTEQLFKDAMSKAGHQATCTKILSRDYAGTPFVADGSNTCVFLKEGYRSVCARPKFDSHRPLCYCSKRLGKFSGYSRDLL